MALSVSADELPEDRPTVVIRASDIQKTGSQVAVLCQIFEATSGFLASHGGSDYKAEIDDTAKIEARKTFELVNARLRDIIDDDRWHTRNTPAEEQSFKLLDAQTVRVSEQTSILQDMQKPHHRLGPKIKFFPEAGWVAWMGEGLPTTHCLHGRGASPAQAYAAFDRNYNQIAPLIMTDTQQGQSVEVKPTPEATKPARKSRKKS